jgi:hypothetical protein
MSGSTFKIPPHHEQVQDAANRAQPYIERLRANWHAHTEWGSGVVKGYAVTSPNDLCFMNRADPLRLLHQALVTQAEEIVKATIGSLDSNSGEGDYRANGFTTRKMEEALRACCIASDALYLVGVL